MGTDFDEQPTTNLLNMLNMQKISEHHLRSPLKLEAIKEHAELGDCTRRLRSETRRLHSDTALGDCNRRLCSETRRLHLETALEDSETAFGGYARRLRLEHAEHAEDF